MEQAMTQAQLASRSAIVATVTFPHSRLISVPSPHKIGSAPKPRKVCLDAVLPKVASSKSKDISNPSPQTRKVFSSKSEINPTPSNLIGIKIPAKIIRTGIGAESDLVFNLLRSLKP